jgi:hypothetical protein
MPSVVGTGLMEMKVTTLGFSPWAFAAPSRSSAGARRASIVSMEFWSFLGDERKIIPSIRQLSAMGT